MASRRIIALALALRRVMAYVASRRIIFLLCCFVGCVMPYMASRRITLLLRLWPLRWTMVIWQGVSCLFRCRSCASVLLLHLPLWNDFFLALASRGTLPRVSQVCANVRMVAGGHCVLGGARMMEASTMKRIFSVLAYRATCTC